MTSKDDGYNCMQYDHLYMVNDKNHSIDVNLLIFKPNGVRYRVSCYAYNNSEKVIVDPQSTYKMRIVVWSTSNYQTSVNQEIGLAWW